MGKRMVKVNDEQCPFWMREVTRLCEDTEHLTQVMTTRQGLESVEVLYRMFNRWRQENFFKYMRQEYAIDGLVEYGAQKVSEEATRPNPERKKLKGQQKRLQTQIERLVAEYGHRVMKEPAPQDSSRAAFLQTRDEFE